MIWVTAGSTVQGTEPTSGDPLPEDTDSDLIWESPTSDEPSIIATDTSG
ncbi:MAG: hypothetical protein ACI8VE_001879 [Natrialbaceae archaeon]|jgi:hypothetical protein